MIIKLEVNGKDNYQCESFLVSFTDANETLLMHTKSDNVVLMRGKETNDIINELINSLIRRH